MGREGIALQAEGAYPKLAANVDLAVCDIDWTLDRLCKKNCARTNKGLGQHDMAACM